MLVTRPGALAGLSGEGSSHSLHGRSDPQPGASCILPIPFPGQHHHSPWKVKTWTSTLVGELDQSQAAGKQWSRDGRPGQQAGCRFAEFRITEGFRKAWMLPSPLPAGQ